MRIIKNFHMAMGWLSLHLCLFSLLALSPSAVFSQTTQVVQLQAQMDSLSRSVERLNIQFDSELKANVARIESIKEATDRMFWIFAVLGAIGSFLGGFFVVREIQNRKDYREERKFYEDRAQKYESHQLELHSRVLRIYENQAQIGEKYTDHTDKMLRQQEYYSEAMGEITRAFHGILDDIKGVLGFRVEESKLAVMAMEEQAKKAQQLPQIQDELAEFKHEREERVIDLLKETVGLARSRHEYTEPDRELHSKMLQFRIKFDALSSFYLEKCSKMPKNGPIFYYRGLIAFLDNDILTASKMFNISERLYSMTEASQIDFDMDFYLRASFTKFYLALIHKNYGNILLAKKFIENAFSLYGENENKELLTLITFAEILSYSPESLQEARNKVEMFFNRIGLKEKTEDLSPAEAKYIPRGFLIKGNTYFIERNWKEAQTAYRDVLKINDRDYYIHHSLGMISQKMGDQEEAQAAFDSAYQRLVESRHLETKHERGTQIILSALAYYCTRNSEKNKEKAQFHLDSVKENLSKVQDLNGYELKLFSYNKKRPVAKDEFWSELLES